MRTFALLTVALFVTASLLVAPLAGAGPSSRDSLTTFTGGAASKTLTFTTGGSDSSTSITISKIAQLSAASLTLTGSAYTSSGSVSYGTKAEFDTGTYTDVNASSAELRLIEANRARELVKDPPYAAGTNPKNMDAGDVNNDGLDDVVVPNWGANTLGVFTQNAAGTLNAQNAINVGVNPNAVVLGDLDGDGLLDAVVVNQGDGTITILFQGVGGLGSPVTYITGSGAASVPLDAAIGDFDSLNGNDIAVSNNADNTVSVFYQGATAGDFSAPPATLALSTNYVSPSGVFAGDVDGDRDDDLAVLDISLVGAGNGGGMSAAADTYINNAGALDPPVASAIGGVGYDGVVADVNGDGTDDIVVTEFKVAAGKVNIGANQVEWFKNPGGAKWGVGTVLGINQGALDLAVGDVNGDGATDIVIGDSLVTASLTGANGGGQGNLGIYAQAAAVPGAEVIYGASMGTEGAATGDFNNDGWTDAVVGNYGSQNIEVFLQKEVVHYKTTGTWVSPVTAGALPLVSATATWTVTIPDAANQTIVVELSNDGGATWSPATSGSKVTFVGSGTQLQVRVTLSSTDDLITPAFDTLTIDYDMSQSPTDVLLTTGGAATPDYSGAGTLSTATADIRASLQSAIGAATAGTGGDVQIPLAVASSTAGKVTLSGLSVTYVKNNLPTAPVPTAPADTSWTGARPTFTMSSTDADAGALLRYTVELSAKSDFQPLIGSYGPTVPGWSKASYASGEAASLSIQNSLASGVYYWRATVKDDRDAISPYSVVWGFRVDLTAPVGSVRDDGTSQTDRTMLHAIFEFTDAESGVVQYSYTIGTKKGLDDVVPATLTTSAEATVNGLSLADGSYYWNVKALNGAGLWSGEVSSDGIDLFTQVCTGGVCNSLPEIAITAPKDQQKVLGPVTITGTAADRDSDPLSVSVRIDSGDWQLASGTDRWNLAWDTLTVTNDRHTISAKASDGKGESPTVSIGVIVTNEHSLTIVSTSPDLEWIMDENTDQEFAVVAVDNNLHALTYAWSVDGRDVSGASKETFTFATDYSSAGIHEVEVTVDDGHSLTATASWSVDVTNINRGPSAVIKSPLDGAKPRAGKAIAFDAAGSADPDGDTLTYTWDFGDGTTGTGLTAKHAYKKAGKVTVTLTVKDAALSANMTVSLTVGKASAQVPGFSTVESTFGLAAAIVILACFRLRRRV